MRTPEQVFGEVVRATRRARGLSQETLAFEAGLDRSYIGLLERGQTRVGLSNLFKLARALQVEPSALIQRVETVEVEPRPRRRRARGAATP